MTFPLPALRQHDNEDELGALAATRDEAALRGIAELAVEASDVDVATGYYLASCAQGREVHIIQLDRYNHGHQDLDDLLIGFFGTEEDVRNILLHLPAKSVQS